MQPRTEWMVGPDAWAAFTTLHPELGYRPGKWQFHNFLRFHRQALLDGDSIRLAKRRFWIAHFERFAEAAFDLATNAPQLCGQRPKGSVA